MKKILSIGNSFSVDALHYFTEITNAAAMDIMSFNLYIGGCSLQLHTGNLESNSPDYICYLNGRETDCKVSIREALRKEQWDIVTIQQASHDSGILDTYEPYGTELIHCIQEYVPSAEIWFHQTWAYEHGSDHPLFSRYDCDQQKMYEAIVVSAEEFTQRHNLPIIPCGSVIQTLRRMPDFDYLNGGRSLCRDSFHMSMSYGRYAVAATWAERLLDIDVRNDSFAPAETELALMEKVREVVHGCCCDAKAFC